MSPTSRITATLAVASVAVVGAGLALANIGPTEETATAATTAAPPSELGNLTRMLQRLDSRSTQLNRDLAQLRRHTSRVQNSSGATVESSSVTQAPAPRTAPSYGTTVSPSPAATDDDGFEADDDSSDFGDGHEDNSGEGSHDD